MSNRHKDRATLRLNVAFCVLLKPKRRVIAPVLLLIVKRPPKATQLA